MSRMNDGWWNRLAASLQRSGLDGRLILGEIVSAASCHCGLRFCASDDRVRYGDERGVVG